MGQADLIGLQGTIVLSGYGLIMGVILKLSIQMGLVYQLVSEGSFLEIL